MITRLFIVSALLAFTACNKSHQPAANSPETKSSSDAVIPEESENAPEPRELPPDITTAVEEVSNEADCRLTHRTWGDMRRSAVKQAELEYKSAEEIKPEFYDLPFGGYFSLRIPRSTFSALKPEFFSIIVLDSSGTVLARPELHQMDVSSNDYGGAFADTGFELTEFIDLPFEVHVVDRVTKKKSIFRVQRKD